MRYGLYRGGRPRCGVATAPSRPGGGLRSSGGTEQHLFGAACLPRSVLRHRASPTQGRSARLGVETTMSLGRAAHRQQAAGGPNEISQRHAAQADRLSSEDARQGSPKTGIGSSPVNLRQTLFAVLRVSAPASQALEAAADPGRFISGVWSGARVRARTPVAICPIPAALDHEHE